MSNNYLIWLSENTRTRWWHDSAIPSEIDAAIANGAAGVTTNPVLAYRSLKAASDFWKPEIDKIPNSLSPVESAEEILRIVTTYAAERFSSIYAKTNHKNGYALAQVNPEYAGDTGLMYMQAKRYLKWAPNIAVKVPTTRAAIPVVERLASEGAAVCTTLNFSVSQALAVAEAYERGGAEARRSGVEVKPCFVVQQGGRLDEYLMDCAKDSGIDIPQDVIRRAGNCVTKRTYDLFAEKNYSAKIMPAGLRGVDHLTRFAGADMVFSLQTRIQNMVIKEDPERIERFTEPNDEKTLEQLMQIEEFKRAFEVDGIAQKDFITFGLTQKTLSQFLWTGWSPLESFVSNDDKRWF